ncbi:MAG: DUF4198 domain-containing protein [Chitinophagaceae bacterium]|nr:DUF4198 domain-containing protein [Chitinophagaceae bacterium]
MKKAIALLVVCCISSWINSHEFWLQPNRFQYKSGDPVRIRFQVGESFRGENWTGTRASVERLELFWKEFDDDLKPLIGDTVPGDSLIIQFFDEGTVMTVFESTDKYIRLDPAEFTAYLQEDGLQNAIDFRAGEGETDSAGREYYRRSVKTIFQVGKTLENRCTKITGLPLDIIPLAHPYALKKGQSLPVEVRFKGEVLPHYRVKLWHRLNSKTEVKDLETDSTGQLRIPVSLAGQWMVSAVRMERIARDSADWQSYWGSLTWGYY